MSPIVWQRKERTLLLLYEIWELGIVMDEVRNPLTVVEKASGSDVRLTGYDGLGYALYPVRAFCGCAGCQIGNGLTITWQAESSAATHIRMTASF